MKMTFKAKIVADITNHPGMDEPTYAWLATLLKEGRFVAEMAMPWSADAEPTVLITETLAGAPIVLHEVVPDEDNQ